MDGFNRLFIRAVIRAVREDGIPVESAERWLADIPSARRYLKVIIAHDASFLEELRAEARRDYRAS